MMAMSTETWTKKSEKKRMGQEKKKRTHFQNIASLIVTHLQSPTKEKLERCVSEQEIDGLENVPRQPEEHHFHAHPLSGAVGPISPKLRHAQHGLDEDGEEADGLHEKRHADEAVHEKDAEATEAKHELNVREKVRPLPKVTLKVHGEESPALSRHRRYDLRLVFHRHAEVQHEHHHDKHKDGLSCEKDEPSQE